MRAPSIGTALRLSRIAALLAACLLFLHACDRTRRLLPTDVWLEFGAAAALAAGAMVAAWFEIARAERIEEAEELEANDPPAPRADDLLYDTATHALRARIAGSGNLVVHGRERGSRYPGREWSWTFRTDTFPAIRNALGGNSDDDVLLLLEEVIPELDADGRADPGAWLRANGINGTYREKGDHPSRTTHKLPILRPGPRRPAESVRAHTSGDESAGNRGPAGPARRSARRASSSRDAPSARSSDPGSRDARSGPNRRVEADRVPPSRRRGGGSAPESGPIAGPGDTASRTRRRTGPPSGPLPAGAPNDSGRPPATGRRPHGVRESAADSGPIAGATKRRAAHGENGTASRSAAESASTTRRSRRRDPDDGTAVPDLPRRTGRGRAVEDPSAVSIHGNRRLSAEQPPPGLFSARTGIEPTDTPPPPSAGGRARSARPTLPTPADSYAGLGVHPGEAARPDPTAFRGYGGSSHNGKPAYDPQEHDALRRAARRYAVSGNGDAPASGDVASRGDDAAYESSDYAPDPAPGLQRRRGHRYL